MKQTPFLKLVLGDKKLRRALENAGFAPADDTPEAWARFEKDQRSEPQLQLGDEWDPFRQPLDFIAFFPNLEFVKLGVTTGVDLSPLRALKKLKVLELTGKTTQPIDLSPIVSLPKLEDLDIRGPRVPSLEALSKARVLRKLGITVGGIADLSPLKGLALTTLYLPKQRLTSLAPLAAMRSLEYLQLPDNQVTDVTPLEALTRLRFLGLEGNAVRDVSPLKKLEHLDTLYLAGNPITDLSPLAALTAVKTKDFVVPAAAVAVDAALELRLKALASTPDCEALLARLLTRLRRVVTKKAVTTLHFDADDHDVVPLALTAPWTGPVAPSLPASFRQLVTTVGATVHVDATRPGVDGPCVGLSRRGTVLEEVEWDGEDRTRFLAFCNAGQNWFVWDTQKRNALKEPGIVFFSHEGALDPKRRFPQQDTLAFGAGGFVLRALAFRVFSREATWRGCGWG